MEENESPNITMPKSLMLRDDLKDDALQITAHADGRIKMIPYKPDADLSLLALVDFHERLGVFLKNASQMMIARAEARTSGPEMADPLAISIAPMETTSEDFRRMFPVNESEAVDGSNPMAEEV